VIPTTDVRRKYSATVVRPIPTERAIVRTLAPHACFSRNTSRTFRIDNLSPGIAVPLGLEDHATGHRIVDFDPEYPLQDCPRSIGITVRLPSESVAAFDRNHWPLSLGFRNFAGPTAVFLAGSVAAFSRFSPPLS
jgi:hypothetical protein